MEDKAFGIVNKPKFYSKLKSRQHVSPKADPPAPCPGPLTEETPPPPHPRQHWEPAPSFGAQSPTWINTGSGWERYEHRLRSKTPPPHRAETPPPPHPRQHWEPAPSFGGITERKPNETPPPHGPRQDLKPGTSSVAPKSLQFDPIADTPVMNVPGIGKKLAETLQGKGFNTVGDLREQKKVYMDWLQTCGADNTEQQAIYTVVKGLGEDTKESSNNGASRGFIINGTLV